MISRKLIYVQAHPGCFFIRVAGEPQTRRVVCDGLTHPRTLVGDHFAIAADLRAALREMWSPVMWVVRPDVVVHLPLPVAGGYTNMEVRAFREAAIGAGARTVYLCDDKLPGPLTDAQLHALRAGAG